MYGRQTPRISRASTVTRGTLELLDPHDGHYWQPSQEPYRIRRLSHSVNIGKEKGWEAMCTMKRWMDTLRKRRCYAETRFKHYECSSRALQKLLLRALKSIQSKRFKIWAFILLANGPYLLYVSSPPVYITWRYSSEYHTQPQFYQAWGKFLR